VLEARFPVMDSLKARSAACHGKRSENRSESRASEAHRGNRKTAHTSSLYDLSCLKY